MIAIHSFPFRGGGVGIGAFVYFLREGLLVFLPLLVVISIKHSVLVYNWNCRELLSAGPELALVFFKRQKIGIGILLKMEIVRIGILLVSKS